MQQVLSIFGGNQMDYAELYLWDIPVVWSKPESGDRELISLRDRTPRIAAEGCDIEALIHSEMGRQMVLQFEDYIRYGDEMDPAYVQKWHAQGLDKQVMGRDDFYHRWALFTPVSAREKAPAATRCCSCSTGVACRSTGRSAPVSAHRSARGADRLHSAGSLAPKSPASV